LFLQGKYKYNILQAPEGETIYTDQKHYTKCNPWLE
jgi:hypothetical protein